MKALIIIVVVIIGIIIAIISLKSKKTEDKGKPTYPDDEKQFIKPQDKIK